MKAIPFWYSIEGIPFQYLKKGLSSWRANLALVLDKGDLVGDPALVLHRKNSLLKLNKNDPSPVLHTSDPSLVLHRGGSLSGTP